MTHRVPVECKYARVVRAINATKRIVDTAIELGYGLHLDKRAKRIAPYTPEHKFPV